MSNLRKIGIDGRIVKIQQIGRAHLEMLARRLEAIPWATNPGPISFRFGLAVIPAQSLPEIGVIPMTI